MLSNHDIGKQALGNLKLLREVVKIKKTFYDSGFAKYEDCLTGNLRLTPNDDYLKLLEADFNKMLSNKMFYSQQPQFDNVISVIKNLQQLVNKNIMSGQTDKSCLSTS